MNKDFKDRIKLALPSVALFTFTFFVFAPIEMYITNIGEFWFTIQQLIAPVVVCLFVAMSLLLFPTLIPKFQKYRFWIAGVFGIGLAVYLQGNWLNLNYGTLDGTPIDWGSFGAWPLINGVIWLVVLAFPFILLIKKPKWFMAVVKYGSYGLIAIECVTLITIFLTTDFTKTSYYLADDPEMLQLSSSGDNVVVFMLDGMEAAYVNEALETKPELKEIFSGFTFYENAVGTAPFSEEGSAIILTGVPLSIDKNIKENVEMIYRDSELFPLLKAKNYDTRIYQASRMVSPDMAGEIKNIVLQQPKVSSYLSLTKQLYKMAAFRYLPHVIKPVFWFSTSDFEQCKAVDTSLAPEYVTGADHWFKQQVQELSVRGSLQQNCFRHYYLKGAHTKYSLDENGNSVAYTDFEDQAERRNKQVVGSMTVVGKYLDELRANGLYDNTTVFVTADHGWDIRQNPALLIKPKNSTGEFQVSEAPISYYEDFMPTLMQAVEPSSTVTKTVYDYQEGESRTRKFFDYSVVKPADRSYNSIAEYETTSAANDFKSYKIKRMILLEAMKYPAYQLGRKLNFYSEDPDGIAYVYYGCSSPEKNFTWTVGQEMVMNFELDKIPTADLTFVLELGGSVFEGEQRVQVYINDGSEPIYQAVVTNETSLQFAIPHSLLKGKKLTINFEFPDAISPKAVDSEKADTRILALPIRTITISEAE